MCIADVTIKDSDVEFETSLNTFSIIVSSSFTDACRDWKKICFSKENPQLVFGGRGSNALRLCRQSLFVLHWPLTTPKNERKPHAIFLLTQLQIKATLCACNEESSHLGTFWTKQATKEGKKKTCETFTWKTQFVRVTKHLKSHDRISLLPPFDVVFG